MNQTINLLSALPKVQRVPLSIRKIGVIWAGMSVLLLLVWGYQLWAAMSLKRQTHLLAQEVTLQTETLRSLADKTAENNPEVIAKTFEQLDKTLGEKSQILNVLSQNTPLAREGFSLYLVHIAESVPDGVWLTQIVISAQGMVIQLSGNAFTNGDILSFVDHLKQDAIFRHTDVRLEQLKSVQVPTSAAGSATEPAFTFVISAQQRSAS